MTESTQTKQMLDDTADASRFLAQATLGADLDMINSLAGQDYGAWIDAQKNEPISTTMPYMEEIYAIQLQDPEPTQADYDFYVKGTKGRPHAINFSTAWMRNIVFGTDYLRQRVAWSLSQILVVSHEHLMGKSGRTIATYYDLLSTHAFGNFRDLLYAVSTSPAMAYFLSSLGNQKADPEINRYPDENYAREIMQLFTIGLWELEMNGERKVDGNGDHIQTYDNEDIAELARVFTGYWFEDVTFGRTPNTNISYLSQDVPMVIFEEEHDRDEKILFPGTVNETVISAETDGLTEIGMVCDMLFNHANTPPFISKQLIQFLVKSHPSPEYVERVANLFVDNGNGVRGDLHAVVKAILLDDEARIYAPNDVTVSKLLEPMVRVSRLVKAFKAGRNEPNFQYWKGNGALAEFGQWPMKSDTVFNFFEPTYTPRQTGLEDAGINAPEFMIIDAIMLPQFANYLNLCIFEKFHTQNNGNPPDFVMDLSDEIAIADDTQALIDHLNLLLCYGELQPQTRTFVEQAIERYPANNDENRLLRVQSAIYFIAISPDGAVLR